MFLVDVISFFFNFLFYRCRLNIENQFLKNMSKTGQWTRNYRMLCRKDVIRCVPGTAIQRFCTVIEYQLTQMEIDE